jgi:hypothetical protein
MIMNTKNRSWLWAAVLFSCIVLSLFSLAGCDSFNGAEAKVPPGLSSDGGPLAGKTFTVAGTSSTTPNDIYLVTGTGTTSIEIGTGSSVATYPVSNATYAVLGAFWNLAMTGTGVGDKIGFDKSGRISALTRNTTTSPLGISIASVTGTNTIAQSAFGSSLTLTGTTASAGFQLDGTLAVNTLSVPVGALVVSGISILNVGKVCTLTGSSSLILTAAASGATLKGAGKVTAGYTEIIGGSTGWKATGTGTVTIAMSSAKDSEITASATTAVLTAGAGAKITQLSGSGNQLTIGTNTTIALSGTAPTIVGTIVLKGNSTASSGGLIELTDTTSKITTGNTDGGLAAGTIGLTGTAGITVIPGLAASTVKALVTGTPAGTAGKLVEIAGAASADWIVTGAPSADATLNSNTIATTY